MRGAVPNRPATARREAAAAARDASPIEVPGVGQAEGQVQAVDRQAVEGGQLVAHLAQAARRAVR